MSNLTLIFVLIIIILFSLIKFRKNFNFKIPKRKSGAASTKPKEKKPFFSAGLKEVIKWSIFLLVCLILIMYLLNFGYSSYKKIINNRYNTSTITKKQSYKQVLGYVDVNFDGKYGDKVYLYKNFPKNARFQFVDATVDYVVINKLNKKAFALAGHNASGQLGLSNGNIWLRFKSQNNQNGNLRIKMYLKK